MKGGSIAQRHNNPGNLVYANQPGATKGEQRPDGTYWAKFDTPQQGYVGVQNQVKLDASRGYDIAGLIKKYAPSSDNNDTNAYINYVVAELQKQDPTIKADTKLTTVINKFGVDPISQAIIKKEDINFANSLLQAKPQVKTKPVVNIPKLPTKPIPSFIPTAKPTTPIPLAPIDNNFQALKDVNNPNRVEAVKKIIDNKKLKEQVVEAKEKPKQKTTIQTLTDELQDLYYIATNPEKSNPQALKEYEAKVFEYKQFVRKENELKKQKTGTLDDYVNKNFTPTVVKPLQKFGLVDPDEDLTVSLPKLESYREKKTKEKNNYLYNKSFENLDMGKHPYDRFRFRYNASNEDPIKVQLYKGRGYREQDFKVKAKGTLIHFLEEDPLRNWKSAKKVSYSENFSKDDYIGVLKKNDDGKTHSILYEKIGDLEKKGIDFYSGNDTLKTFQIPQIKFDDIDFNNKVVDSNYKGNYYWTNKWTGQKTRPPISVGTDENSYTYASGQSAIFIFNKDGKTRYIHFANSPALIRKEGERIKKEYGLKKGQLILAVADAGSYSAAVRANEEGYLDNKLLNDHGYGYYNANSYSGAGAAIIE
jgi:hypothetical protein